MHNEKWIRLELSSDSCRLQPQFDKITEIQEYQDSVRYKQIAESFPRFKNHPISFLCVAIALCLKHLERPSRDPS